VRKFLQSLDFNITPIVAYVFVFFTVIMGALALEQISKAGSTLQEKVAAAQNELAILDRIKDTDIWEDRLALSLEIKSEAETKIWTGDTTGVIAARLQQTLRNIAKANNIKNIRLRVDPEPSQVEFLEILAFDFQGHAAETRTLIDILSTMANHPQTLLIKEATIVNSVRARPPTLIKFSGFVPIRITPKSGVSDKSGVSEATPSDPAGI